MFGKIFNKAYIKILYIKYFIQILLDNNNIIIQSLCHI